MKLWSFSLIGTHLQKENNISPSLVPLWRKKLLLYSIQVLQLWTMDSHTWGGVSETHLQSPAGKWVITNTEYSRHYSPTWVWEISKAEELTASPGVRWNTVLPSQLGKKKKSNVFQNQIQRPKVNLWPLSLFRTLSLWRTDCYVTACNYSSLAVISLLLLASDY